MDPRDRLVVALLRDPKGALAALQRDTVSLVARADLHGVGGVLQDALEASLATVDPGLRRALEAKAIASAMNHAAHLVMLDRVDGALHSAGIRGVILKGALFAERYYARPEARAATDIDLLVDGDAVERSTTALAPVGYEPFAGPREAWFRRHHHHVHLVHPHALPLELHFHAYRGFGRILPSAPLLDRHRPFERYRTLGVLAPEDELVYLAVHAAGHRFSRLGWLYDVKLLLETMSAAQISVAAERARAWGYARPLALTARLLVDLLGAEPQRLAPLRELGELGAWSTSLLLRITREPSNALLRSATRFVYTAALSPTPLAAAQYASVAVLDRLGRAARTHA